MLLLIDAGNTRIKWAVVAHDATRQSAMPAWLYLGSVSHADMPALPEAWRDLGINRVVISNVAGLSVLHNLVNYLHQAAITAHPECFAAAEQVAGVKNNYRNPAQLGCDRLAAAIGAHALFPKKALIVATCGTATTIDALSAEGVFYGGMILPGLKLMAQALAKNTAQLPQVAESITLSNLFADNTESAIVSGCINAQVGAIERAVTRWQTMQSQTVTCLISGGAAPYLLPHLGIASQHVDNLVLTGLAIAAASETFTYADIFVNEKPC